MKQKAKNKLNIFIILILTIIVLIFALKDDFNEIINQIVTIDIKYLILSFGLVLAYFYLRTIVFNDLVKKFKKDYSFKKAFALTLKTQFFNGVTPFSTGGQPFQVYMLKKSRIKISHATNIVIQNFIVYQIALVLLGTIAIISNHFLNLFESTTFLKNLVTLGFIINILVTLGLFTLAFTVKINKMIGTLAIKILKKLNIVKEPQKLVDKWNGYVENFHDGAIILLSNKRAFLKGIFYNFMALCSLYLIPLTLLYGMGNIDAFNAYECIITSSYVMLIGSFVPIPGGSGGLEYGFVVFFCNFLKGAMLKSIMLIWRFITYYFGIILGAIVLNFEKKEK